MLKQKDIEIMKHLRKNARISLADISRESNIPISTVFDKLNRFEDKYIHKHVSLLDFPALGYSIKVNFLLKCKDRDKMKDFLMNSTDVNTVYRINNGNDFIVECIFKDLNALENFSEQMENYGLEKKEKFHILEELKKESFFEKEEKK